MENLITVPKQKRSAKTYEKVVRAGVKILVNGKNHNFSILEISKLSGVSVGSIYQRFENKDKLYLVLQNEILNNLDEEASDRFPKDISYETEVEAIHDSVHRFAQHIVTNEALLRGMILRGMTNDQANLRGHRSSQHIGNEIKKHLKRNVKSANHTDLDKAFDMLFRIVFSCLWRWLLEKDAPETERSLKFEEMIDELCVVCERYILN